MWDATFLATWKYETTLTLRKNQDICRSFSAIGAESRLRIMESLITAAPQGQKTVGEIQEEIGIPWSTLSHHLEKLRNEDLVTTRREG